MKEVTRYCDKCKKLIVDGSDAKARDTIDREYPQADLCENCYLDCEFMASAAKGACIKGVPIQEYLKGWLDMYK